MTGHSSLAGKWSLAKVSTFEPTGRDWSANSRIECNVDLGNARVLEIAQGPGPLFAAYFARK